MSTQDIYNHIRISEEIAAGGQPSEEQLREAAAEGFTAVVNLATLDPRHALPDEAGLVRSLGMAYHHIPVEWENPKATDFEAFETVMAALAQGKTLIHCAANFRVTAFYALYAQKHLGWPEARCDELRARIWKDRKLPVWERFVAAIKAGIAR